MLHKKNKKMDDEEYPNKKTEELFEGAENGDEEVVYKGLVQRPEYQNM